MSQINTVILCLAYIIGLLFTSISWGSYGVVALGVLLSYGANKNFAKESFNKERKLKSKLFLAAGIVGFLATVYFQIRTPQPAINDISQFINNKREIVTVQGEISSLPRLTRSQKGQVWLKTKELNQTGKAIKVTGNLYVTVPLCNLRVCIQDKRSQLKVFSISQNLQITLVVLTLNDFCNNKVPLRV